MTPLSNLSPSEEFDRMYAAAEAKPPRLTWRRRIFYAWEILRGRS